MAPFSHLCAHKCGRRASSSTDMGTLVLFTSPKHTITLASSRTT